MAERIAAAVSARVSPDFAVVGRTDALAVEGLDAAVERARRCVAAGADIIFLREAASSRRAAAYTSSNRYLPSQLAGSLAGPNTRPGTTMCLDTTPEILTDPDSGLRALWNGHGRRRRSRFACSGYQRATRVQIVSLLARRRFLDGRS
jgi:hypothetical protein